MRKRLISCWVFVGWMGVAGLYGVTLEQEFWATVDTPILLSNPWLLCNNRWQRHNGSDSPSELNDRDNQFREISGGQEGNLLLSGVSLANGNQVQMYHASLTINSSHKGADGFNENPVMDPVGTSTRGPAGICSWPTVVSAKRKARWQPKP